MAEPIVWENIPKSQADATTISEAIGDAIEVHNADSEAHMAALAALGSHRENSIVDHPAESVVNDKLAPRSRAYVAIVDPSSDTDFDTIESAHSYAVSKGGGNILLVEGTHYLTTHLEWNASCNLVGIDRDTCQVVTDYSTGSYITIPDVASGSYNSCIFQNLSFIAMSSVVFGYEEYTYLTEFRTNFNACNFIGGFKYIESATPYQQFTNCYFDCGTVAAIEGYTQNYVLDCEIRTSLTSGTAVFMGANVSENYNRMINCYSNPNDARPIDYIGQANFSEGVFTGNVLYNAVFGNCEFYSTVVANNTIALSTTSYINVISYRGSFTGNNIYGGTGNRLRFAAGANNNVVVGNNVGTSITNSGTNNVIASNLLT